MRHCFPLGWRIQVRNHYRNTLKEGILCYTPPLSVRSWKDQFMIGGVFIQHLVSYYKIVLSTMNIDAQYLFDSNVPTVQFAQ